MSYGKTKNKITTLLPNKRIENLILVIRGQKVILDRDLADLYQVRTKRLNEQVKRNIKRFPEDFMFQLTEAEKIEVVANCDHLQILKFSPQFPYVFTEQGVAMLSSVLNSDRAILMNIQIMRAFTKLREMMIFHKEFAGKMEDLESKFTDHDKKITVIFDAIRQLLEKPEKLVKKKGPIGFIVKGKNDNK